MSIKLLHNHKSYEDFEIVKILVLPDKMSDKDYEDVIKDFHKSKNRLPYKEVLTRVGRSDVIYYWFREDGNDTNKLDERYNIVSWEEAKVSTWDLYSNDEFHKFLESKGIRVLEPKYSV